MKRPREDEGEDDEPLVFKHMKRTNVEDGLETSKDSESLRRGIQEDMQSKEYMMEGPSDRNAEVGEEALDKDLARVFHKHN